LLDATVLGRKSNEGGNGIALFNSECVYLTGYTQSSELSTTPGAVDTAYVI
jgi:hypothetical protein